MNHNMKTITTTGDTKTWLLSGLLAIVMAFLGFILNNTANDLSDTKSRLLKVEQSSASFEEFKNDVQRRLTNMEGKLDVIIVRTSPDITPKQGK